MDATRRIWVALDAEKPRALEVVEAVEGHPAVLGFKANSLVDEEVFRDDGQIKLFDRLLESGLPIWVDLKFHDVPRTIGRRMRPYVEAGVGFVTVMAKGGIPMMMDAVEAGGTGTFVIAVTELTSLSEEEVHLGSGHPAKASVINLAGNAVHAGVEYLVCSGQELQVLGKQRHLQNLSMFVPAVKPKWSLAAGADQSRVVTPEQVFKGGGSAAVMGSAIMGADDPFEAVDMTAKEIEAIEEDDED
ncbi:orotidine 5'-phosphate decarboxylase [Candidatus Falkowbacteria bacterium]|nr:orotidine 5'-phosphate decarboxylase [Candidatus Falkowbacteria bacterium]